MLPHMSLVEGEKNVKFLRKRYAAMENHPLFRGMEYTEDLEKLKEWVPLIMEGRTSTDPIAATRITTGTDVNFGARPECCLPICSSRVSMYSIIVL